MQFSLRACGVQFTEPDQTLGYTLRRNWTKLLATLYLDLALVRTRREKLLATLLERTGPSRKRDVHGTRREGEEVKPILSSRSGGT